MFGIALAFRYLCGVMITHPLWTDECWLPLLGLYYRHPEGLKPVYSRGMVELALELHIPPQTLYDQMFRLARPTEPSLVRLRRRYDGNRRRLSRDVRTLRRMAGFSSGGGFYDGVEVRETFERDFRELKSLPGLKPVMLIMALDLYFRLTPQTMVEATPEVAALARLMKVKPHAVVSVLTMFQACDPYLRRDKPQASPLYAACHDVWQRYGNGEPQHLAALAAQMREYFK